MKRRNLKVNTQATVHVAKVAIEGKECKAIVFDHHKRLCFKEVNTPGKNAIGLSLGVFSKEPFKYDCIKRPLATKFNKNDSRKLTTAIKMVELTETKELIEPIEPETETEMTVEPDVTKTVETATIIDIDSDLKKEKECYDHAVKYANRVIAAIESLETSGIPKEYISSRYPDIRTDILSGAAAISIKWSDLNTAVYKKSSIEERIRALQQQAKEADYQVYLAKEAYIITMQDQTSHLEGLDSIMAMVEEDQNELKRLNRIRELEEELATLKGESKFSNSDTPSQPKEQRKPKKEEEKVPVELEVGLATEVQDREIRYLANHLYQVRRGNEDHNPVIYRKIAELSENMKLSKPEFCKKILSINYNTYDRHHKAFMNSLGLHIYGERTTLKPVDMDPEEVKARVLQWANIHLIPVEDNKILNKEVYNSFVNDTTMEIAELSFYLILKRRGGYVTKTAQNYEVIDDVKKLVSKTFYIGYQLV